MSTVGLARDVGPKHQKGDKKDKKAPAERVLKEDERVALIGKAQIWSPTNIAEMDLKAGPQGPGSFPPNTMVTCDFVDKKLPGASPKFACEISEDDVAKVRFGEQNGEVQGSVLATRLLWALGFGADRVYPVRVTCRGCPADPFKDKKRVEGDRVFDPADIERKADGHELKSARNDGWGWPELDQVDSKQGGAPKEQRDALKLLAVFMQHTDSKPIQQRLLCLPDGMRDDGGCDKPFMMIHDVGLTFGHANFTNGVDRSAVNFDEWSRTPVWRDAKACTGHLSQSYTGTLGDDPKISEAGRKFLADMLVQLTDQQLHDLFEAARVEMRSRKPNSSEPPATIDEWVAAFKHKRDEIVNNHCS